MEKLNVLILATRDWYHPETTGGDNTMWEQARYLAWAGHSVTLVTAGYRGAPREEVVDGMKVVRLGGIHTLWLRTFVYYMTRCRGHFDVVVAEGFGGSRIPRFAPLYVREPIITEWHQIHRDLFAAQYPKVLGGPLNLLEHVTAWVHRNTLVRAGTEEWRQAFPSIGFKPENVFVLPVSIRDDWLTASEGEPTEQQTILWLGKFRRYKCPHHAVRAMSQVTHIVPGANLVLAGRHDDRTYERSLVDLAQKLGVEGRTEFCFDLDEAEKRALMRKARIVVVTSAVEGFGLVVLEANACGLPVVASNGVPEGAVRDGYNGLRYQFGDIDSLAAAMLRLLTDDDLYQRLSRNARAFAQGFGWRDVGARFEQIVAHAARRELVTN
jgi:glycosyltransferase involved in cell wall biosynthesis